MIKLRKFSLFDLNRILEIEKVSFPNPHYSRFRHVKYFEKLYKEYPEGFIVAEDKKRVIGYIAGQVKNKSGEIVSLAVDPISRRKGIGKNLTDSLIVQFKGKGIKEIFLHVRTGNKLAISFHENLNFKTLKIIKNYYPNGEDAFLMKKEI